MFQFSSIGILALVALVMCWSLAAVLFRVGAPDAVALELDMTVHDH